MRSYSNYLLFEDVLDDVASEASCFGSVASNLLTPTVKVIENDCGTLLGTVEDLDFEKEGKIELATNLPLTPSRISQLLGQGAYKVSLRNTNSCISQGGICQKCYLGSYLGSTAPDVGHVTTLTPMLNYQSDRIRGDGYSKEYALTQSSDDYYSYKVFSNGVLQPSSSFTITDTPSIILPNPVGVTTSYVVQYYIQNSDSLLGYLSRSYSGGLLGIKPLPSFPLIIREDLYNDIVSDGEIAVMLSELEKFDAIPKTYFEFLDRIHNRLEKALHIIYLYATYSNFIN